MEGWIKLHRKLTKWEWYQDGNTTRLFLHLLLMANHQDGRWQGIEVKRGQHITGRKRLAKDLKLSEKKIRTSLNKLKTANEVTIESTSMYSIVTITNYNTYNKRDLETANETANNESNERPTDGQQEATNKNEKNEKKKDINNALPSSKEKKPKRTKAKPVRDNPPTSLECAQYCDQQEFNPSFIDPDSLYHFYVTDKPKGQEWTYANGKDVMNWKSLFRNIHDSNKKAGKVINNNFVQDSGGVNKYGQTKHGERFHGARQDDEIIKHGYISCNGKGEIVWKANGDEVGIPYDPKIHKELPKP